MSYTIVDDGPVIQVRASIADRDELQSLIEGLQKRFDKMPASSDTGGNPQQEESK